MDVAPAAVAAVPEAGFFEGLRCRGAVGTDALDETYVGHKRHIAKKTDAGPGHGRLMRALDAAQIEIETVEGEAFDQLAPGLRLEGRKRRIAQFFVRGPVGAGDAVEQPLGYLQQF